MQVPTSLLSSIFYWIFFDRVRLCSGSTLDESFASLYPICFLVPSFLKNLPRFLPILFLVEVISSTTYLGHTILPSSSRGLQHQEKNHVLITTKYLSKYFLQNIQETSSSGKTSSHFEELSKPTSFPPSIESF